MKEQYMKYDFLAWIVSQYDVELELMRQNLQTFLFKVLLYKGYQKYFHDR